MTTPIYNFVRKYADSDAVRAHMPGHKGKSFLGCETLDLTEISGADELFAPDGIIAESEANASKIFGCPTFYSTEGSSLCIRAMLFLAMRAAQDQGRKPLIAAARNAHRTFLTAAALLDFDIIWLPQDTTKSYLSCCEISALRECLAEGHRPTAVYLTSPDYLGNIADIHAFSSFCHENDMLLIVDNAHGAYLKFLPESLHPIDLGADLCCDSAHKTLPVLTGGAYLHLHPQTQENLRKYAKNAMALFASTSPSYLILESLDLCNNYLFHQAKVVFKKTIMKIIELKSALIQHGWTCIGNESFKITILPKPYGFTGTELSRELENHRIYAEYADSDYLVLMLSPQNSAHEFEIIREAFCAIKRRSPIQLNPPKFNKPECVISPRDAIFAQSISLPVEQCNGRICAEFAVSCPPAVPIVMCGEKIDFHAIEVMKYYGIRECRVVK